MGVITKQNVHFPRLYTIHSQKGGVGKTSIAIAIAGFAAIIHEKKALIIDADMTGVSLYDMGNWSDGKNPRYLNEILLASPRCYESILDNKRDNNRALCNYFHNIPAWDNIKYIPASPCIDDITGVVPLISQEDFHHFFRYRIEDVITAAVNDQFEVIVVDNSPGLFGVSKSTLQIALDGPSKHALLKETQAIIVTSTDPPDYLSLFPSLSNILEPSKDKTSRFDFILNKIAKSEQPQDEAFIYRDLLEDLRKKNFADGRKLYPGFIDTVTAKIQKNGGLAAPYVEGFHVDEILPTIKRIKSSDTKQSAGIGRFEQWCRDIGTACGLGHKNRE